MKSNEEFIAGIYEKAANYTEKEEKKEKRILTAPVLRVAAMLAVCAGLAGVGILMLPGKTDESTKLPEEVPGISMLSEPSDEVSINPAVSQYRTLPEEKNALLEGTVESVDTQENIIWIQTENMGVVSLIAVKWEATKEIPTEIVAGARLRAEGEVSTYDNKNSERFGSSQLTVTDAAKFWIWAE